MYKSRKKVVFVVGATASGKTGLGVFLAKKFGGEIISADSRQVYRGLDIGTGKDLKEYGKVKYHLIDICNPEERFTMFDWKRLAEETMEEIWKKGKVPIVVGGTGLYVEALLKGYALRKNKRLNIKYKRYGREELNRLKLLDLQKIAEEVDGEGYNEVDKENPRRLIRLIERAQSGEEMVEEGCDFDYVMIGPMVERGELIKKIDKRVEERFEEGMLSEVWDLLNKGVSFEWMQGLGLEYKIVSNFIQNKKLNIKNKKEENEAYQQMLEELKLRIRQFAKRQGTWFRRYSGIKMVSSRNEAEKITENFLN